MARGYSVEPKESGEIEEVIEDTEQEVEETLNEDLTNEPIDSLDKEILQDVEETPEI